MRKYHGSNLGDYRISDDIEFSESMTPQDFYQTYGRAWDDGRNVALGDGDITYCVEIDGTFLLTGMNDGRIDCWQATIFADIEGYVWEAENYATDNDD